MTGQNNIKFKKPFFKNLDALRFLAAFSVFLFHFFNEVSALYDLNTEGNTYKLFNLFFSKGNLGVNFFFVLSGFLITYLILWERQQTQHFNIKRFLIRRTLRIWPLYFFIVFIGFFAFPLLLNEYNTNHSEWYYIFFLANFDEINVGLQDSINFLTAPWSVAVEEQFYLFWGTLLFVIQYFKKFKLWPILITLLLCSLIFSFLQHTSPRILYYHTFSVMSNIVIGSTLALCFFQEKKWLITLKRLKKWQIIFIYLIGLSLIILKNKIFISALVTIEQSVISLFFAFIILDQIYLSNSFFKIGRINLLNKLGKISYGLYLYHLLVMYLIFYFAKTWLLSQTMLIGVSAFLIISTLSTYILSYFSYQYLEKPFLRLKKKFH